jgi:hypothetical protein
MLRYSGLKLTEHLGSWRSEALRNMPSAITAEQAPFVWFEVAFGKEVGIRTADAMVRREDSAAVMEVEIDMV